MRKATKYYNTVNRKFYLLLGLLAWMGIMSLLVLAGTAAKLTITG